MEKQVRITITEDELWLLSWALITAMSHEEQISKYAGIDHPIAERCQQRAQEMEELRNKLINNYELVEVDDE